MSQRSFPSNLAMRFAAVILFLAVLVSPVLAATPSGPKAVIASGSDRAMEILRSQQQKGAPTLKERRDEILQIVSEYFDFEEMAKRALGRPWKEQPPAKQQEFVRLFKQMLFNTYVDRVETYNQGSEKVAYDDEKIEGNYALVKTRITGIKDAKNADVSVDYRMLLENGEWKVYDIIVEGISFVNNYRQQFTSILSSGSFDSLLSRMREKVAMQAGI